MDCVPDTHALVWLLEGSEQLSAMARETITSPHTNPVVPTIVLAEIEYLYRKSRIWIDLESVLAHLEDTENCLVYPLDQHVVTRLPKGLEMHDGRIVATALVNQELLGRETAIVTKDAMIRDFNSIEIVW